MAFNKIDNAYSKFNFEISFKPEKLNGLILYNGQRRPNGDYISVRSYHLSIFLFYARFILLVRLGIAAKRIPAVQI